MKGGCDLVNLTARRERFVSVYHTSEHRPLSMRTEQKKQGGWLPGHSNKKEGCIHLREYHERQAPRSCVHREEYCMRQEAACTLIL